MVKSYFDLFMLDRIIISLCHPSKIGYFFKDKLYKVILYAFGFFLLYVLVCGLTSYSTTYFSSDVVDGSVDSLVSFETSTVVYDISYEKSTKKLSTTSTKAIVMETSDVIYCFFTDSVVKTDENSKKIVYIFNENNAYVYYSNTKVGEVSYTDLTDVDSFTIKDVVSGDSQARGAFKDMIITLAYNSKFGVSTVMFVSSMLTGLAYYLIALIVIFGMSYFVNFTIATNVRTKLCLYDSLIFLVLLSFYIGFSQNWIFYIAIIAPVIFVNFTFTHIIKR